MKTIVAIAALAVALASPVMAQQVQEPIMPFAQTWDDPAQAFAQSNGAPLRARSPNPAWDVYNSAGEYIGSDPDPHVRSQLAGDPPGKNDD